MQAIEIIEISNHLRAAYIKKCSPLCKTLELPQPALDIIMFLANNPEYCTASHICEYKHIKPNLVSLYVDKLVEKGMLEREAVKEDRRQIHLVCTEKAKHIIDYGHRLQSEYFKEIMGNISKEELKILSSCLEKFNINAEKIIKDKTE